jgi:hypothetical protein
MGKTKIVTIKDKVPLRIFTGHIILKLFFAKETAM